MTYNIQITLDCTNTHDQADWWAETLGWVVEPTDQTFIDDVLVKGWAQPDELRARLEGRGAQFLYQANQGPHVWYTMADPEGNEFCLG